MSFEKQDKDASFLKITVAFVLNIQYLTRAYMETFLSLSLAEVAVPKNHGPIAKQKKNLIIN